MWLSLRNSPPGQMVEILDRALDRALARAKCKALGHDVSWVYAASLGFMDQAVCARCGKRL